MEEEMSTVLLRSL